MRVSEGRPLLIASEQDWERPEINQGDFVRALGNEGNRAERGRRDSSKTRTEQKKLSGPCMTTRCWVGGANPRAPPAVLTVGQYLILLQQLHHGVPHEEHVGFLVFAVRDKPIVLLKESSAVSAQSGRSSPVPLLQGPSSSPCTLLSPR